MKRLLLLALLCFAAGIWIFEQIQVDAGYILISLRGTSYETSFWFAVIALITVLACIALMLYVIVKMITAFIRGRRWFGSQRSQSIERHYREGLLHYLTGNWQEAAKQLSALSRKNELPVVRAIAAAQSVAKYGDSEKALVMLQDAEEKHGSDIVWILKSRMALLLDMGQHEKAKNLLSQLKILAPKDSVVKGFELKCLMLQSNAIEASKQIPQLVNMKGGASEEVATMYCQAIQQLQVEPQYNFQMLSQYWAAVPKAIQAEPEVIVAYSEALLALEENEILESLIVKTLRKHWISALVDLYAKLDSTKPDQQLQKAEAWLKGHKDSEALLKTLGILSFKQQLWGKARSYFEQALEVHESHQVIYLLGLVSEKMGELEQSQSYFKRAASLNI